MKEYLLTPEQMEKIKKKAYKYDRIELIPCKEGKFKISYIRKENED